MMRRNDMVAAFAQRDVVISEMFHAGASDNEIAAALGINNQRTIAGARWRLKLLRERPPLNGWWTKERIAILRRFFADELSFSEIAARMNTSKNAVISKAKRIGLPERRASTIMPAPLPVIEFPASRFCAWPNGHPNQPESFSFCSAPVAPNRPYCAEHCSIAYIRSDDCGRTLSQVLGSA